MMREYLSKMGYGSVKEARQALERRVLVNQNGVKMPRKIKVK